jgi:hypothetical protein
MDQNPNYVIGWGTLALINAGLAQGKERSGFGWFILSLFLGPIATLAIVVLPKLPPLPEVVPRPESMPWEEKAPPE